MLTVTIKDVSLLPHGPAAVCMACKVNQSLDCLPASLEGLLHLLKGGRLFDITGGGEDVEGNHDEDEEAGLDEDGNEHSSSLVKGFWKVEQAGPQGCIHYQENGCNC